ncbi:GIY-YIG nuclease family protein [Cytobacillus gottheilii]|uniref:GIY-YIG nuclease family protein n=1 Tax=Cytobacillus gottheilii TaxID=859144 RepID=UPI0009B9DB65|nr:GIY-YIG nuclease family protein [Cytobacillus gottheilii]
MNIKDKAKQLPSSPGVYLMKDSSNYIIYVGKSKSLKSRVQSYMNHSKNHTKKVERLVDHLTDFDYILTDTEFEAFILECELIKELKPTYNRKMKTPKSYSYLKIQRDTHSPSIKLTNTKNNDDGSLYFGPYTGQRTIENALNGMKLFYKIDCNHPMNHRTPCFNYTIGKCMGICFKSSAMEEYRRILDKIIDLLHGTDTKILQEMEEKMIEAAADFHFEMAAEIKTWLKSAEILYKKGQVLQFTNENNYILVMEYLEENKMKLFLIRRNKVLYKQIYDLREEHLKQLILTHLHPHLKTESLPAVEINQDELDEAQIIYSYLNSNACEYVIVPEQSLYGRVENGVEQAVHNLLYSKTTEVN